MYRDWKKYRLNFYTGIQPLCTNIITLREWILIKENVIIGSKAPHINRPLIIGVALVNTGISLKKNIENTEKYCQGHGVVLFSSSYSN